TPVADRDYVVATLLEAVIGLDHSGRAALGRNRVATHGIDLGNDGNAELGIDLSRSDGSAQPCASATYQKDVVRRGVHGLPTAAFQAGSRSSPGPSAGTFSSN